MRGQQLAIRRVDGHQRIIQEAQFHGIDIEDQPLAGANVEREEVTRLLLIEHAAQRYREGDALRILAGTGRSGELFFEVGNHHLNLERRFERAGERA